MKKRILAFLMAATMVLGLAACGGSESGNGSGSADNGSEGGKAGFETTSDWAGPSGTVNIVVPAGAGGNTDLSARVFAQYAKQITGKDFIVVNANGASGSVAANQVLGAKADGETFLYGHNLVNVANIAGITDYNYSAFKLGPTFAKDPAQQLYVNSEKYADLNAFIEAAKAAPGQLKVATEVGAYTYYEVLLFQKLAGIELQLVDAGSNSDKITAMLAGSVDLMPGAYINCKDYLASGKFACLGCPSEERYELIKDIPTMKEQGIDMVYPDCDFSFYFPAETPDNVITWYEDLVKAMLEMPEVQEGIAGVDMMPYYLSGADSAAHDEEIYNTIKGIADTLAK